MSKKVKDYSNLYVGVLSKPTIEAREKRNNIAKDILRKMFKEGKLSLAYLNDARIEDFLVVGIIQTEGDDSPMPEMHREIVEYEINTDISKIRKEIEKELFKFEEKSKQEESKPGQVIIVEEQKTIIIKQPKVEEKSTVEKSKPEEKINIKNKFNDITGLNFNDEDFNSVIKSLSDNLHKNRNKYFDATINKLIQIGKTKEMFNYIDMTEAIKSPALNILLSKIYNELPDKNMFNPTIKLSLKATIELFELVTKLIEDETAKIIFKIKRKDLNIDKIKNIIEEGKDKLKDTKIQWLDNLLTKFYIDIHYIILEMIYSENLSKEKEQTGQEEKIEQDKEDSKPVGKPIEEPKQEQKVEQHIPEEEIIEEESKIELYDPNDPFLIEKKLNKSDIILGEQGEILNPRPMKYRVPKNNLNSKFHGIIDKLEEEGYELSIAQIYPRLIQVIPTLNKVQIPKTFYLDEGVIIHNIPKIIIPIENKDLTDGYIISTGDIDTIVNYVKCGDISSNIQQFIDNEVRNLNKIVNIVSTDDYILKGDFTKLMYEDKYQRLLGEALNNDPLARFSKVEFKDLQNFILASTNDVPVNYILEQTVERIEQILKVVNGVPELIVPSKIVSEKDTSIEGASEKVDNNTTEKVVEETTTDKKSNVNTNHNKNNNRKK